MTYAVKEIFYTLQGEGANAGRAAVFCRFSGCNLWSGRETDRSSAICQFCDTDFVGTDGTDGGKYETPGALAAAIARHWPVGSTSHKFVVFTGGEPLLQVDLPLLTTLHVEGFRIAVETNGTLLPPLGLDWICVSPKAHAPLKITSGDEIKVVIPQDGIDLESLSNLRFANFFVQPMAGPNHSANVELAIDWCLHHPKWRLSLQTHKLVGIR